MKVFALFMACLVLLLSVQPCADNDESTILTFTNTKTANDPAQHEDKTHNDNCTPFCHCSCCAGVSIDHIVTDIVQPYLHLTNAFLPSLATDLLQVSLPVWQPPCLS